MGINNLKVRKGGPDDFQDDDTDSMTPDGGLGEEVEKDPPPRRTGGDRAPQRPARRVTKQIRDDIREKVAVMGDLAATFWEARDPHCAGAFAKKSEDIYDRLTKIICKNPSAVHWFTAGDGYTDWLLLTMEVAPVIGAIVRHHVMHAEVDAPEADLVDLSAYAAPRIFHG